jgi:small neutral amino acid transporter SnatA (MarC family)
MRQFVLLALMLFVVLGPARVAQALEGFPGDLSDRQARGLAMRAVAIATGVTLALALLGVVLRRAWDLSWGAAGVAMGVILLAGALHNLFPARSSRLATPDGGGAAGRPAPGLSLVSPFGMAVVLLGLTWAPS